MKKFTKRSLASLLSLCFAFGMIACGGEEDSSSSNPVSSSQTAISSVSEFSEENSSKAESSEETSSEEYSSDNSSEENSSSEEYSSESSSEENSSSEEDSGDGVIASAKQVVDEVLSRPDAWSFLPEAFQQENMAYSATAFPVTNFSSNTNVSSISNRFIGTQMMVVYDGLLTMQSAFEKVDVVFALGETLASAYQTFINDNPENYTTFTTTLAGLNIKIALEGKQSTLLVGNSQFSAELHADGEEHTNSARIQLTSGVALKYETTEDSLIYAYQAGVGSAMRTVNASFVRDEDTVTGYVYEFTGIGGTGITTTAVFTSDEAYTKVVAKKRESDDLLVLGNEEVYDSQTGAYVSGVVSETLKVVDFETYWFNLCDVSGFNTVKVVKGNDGDKVYVNGSNSVFATKKMSLINISRRYDIEMKTVHYVKAVQSGGETSYELVKTEIPMLFAQTETFEDLGDDIKSENKNAFSVTPTVKFGIAEVALEDFETLKGLFDVIQTLTYESVVNYIGEKDEFFMA